jgi:predicted transcriptional regulator
MEKRELTEKGWELIEAIRNLKNEVILTFYFV